MNRRRFFGLVCGAMLTAAAARTGLGRIELKPEKPKPDYSGYLTDPDAWFIKMDGDFDVANMRYVARERFSAQQVWDWRAIYGSQG